MSEVWAGCPNLGNATLPYIKPLLKKQQDYYRLKEAGQFSEFEKLI